MDAKTILEAVAETYAKLQSFEVEILSTSESGDDDSFHRNTQRARAFFVAPDKLRIEQSRPHGTVTVSDGIDIHHYFRMPKHYSRFAAQPEQQLQGAFRPEFPLASGTIFLFGRIAETIATAAILREEQEAVVISVTYDPPDLPHFAFSSSPVTYWIDTRTNLVSRIEGESTFRRPMDNQPDTSKHTFDYAHASANQLIPKQTFEYVPPADAIDVSHQRSGGCGTMGSDEGKSYQTWHSDTWAGDTFVDQFKLKIRDLDFTFERRLTFVDDNIQIAEKITSPKGVTERDYSIPVSE
jgi:outer membrane lipoprotein-sorting protein